MTSPATPEPGASALDTPEAREVVTVAFTAAHRLLAKNATVREDAVMGATWDAVLVTLAPYVASAQAAAWRAGVEAAAVACAGIANGALIARSHGIIKPYDADTVERVAGACAGAIRALRPPAAFAAPGPDAGTAP